MAKNPENEATLIDELAALRAENQALKQEIDELKEILAAVEKNQNDNKELLEAKGLVIVTNSLGKQYKTEKRRRFLYQGKEMKCEELVKNPQIVDFLLERGVNFLQEIKQEG